MGIPPSHARLALAEMTARNILMNAHITKPPVPVKLILEKFSEIHFFIDELERGFCLERAAKYLIFINRQVDKNRCSYTWAHELGHLCMNHLKINQTKVSMGSVQRIRVEADCFARNFLIPKEWLRSVCAGGPLIHSDIHLLAIYFGVPEPVMEHRLHELGIHYSYEIHDRNKWLPRILAGPKTVRLEKHKG